MLVGGSKVSPTSPPRIKVVVCLDIIFRKIVRPDPQSSRMSHLRNIRAVARISAISARGYVAVQDLRKRWLP